MWIHKPKQIAFIANPRTGTRDTAYITLQKRGFEQFCEHHGVPWGPGFLRTAGPRDMSGPIHWWWSQDHYQWSFYGTHRNHFEVFHSIAHIVGLEHASAKRLEAYIWTHAAHYRGSGVLFPCFFEVATCRELRFAHLREDVDAMLRRHHLKPLQEGELRRETAQHHTHNKPRGERYQDVLSPPVREWIERSYGTEMERFGYSWEE